MGQTISLFQGLKEGKEGGREERREAGREERREGGRVFTCRASSSSFSLRVISAWAASTRVEASSSARLASGGRGREEGKEGGRVGGRGGDSSS